MSMTQDAPEVAQEKRKIGYLEDVGADVTSRLPLAIRSGLDLYAQYGYPVGHFLQAVLRNDFMDAICRADLESLRAIDAIARYVYNALPAPCHGSREAYSAWIAKGEASR